MSECFWISPQGSTCPRLRETKTFFQVEVKWEKREMCEVKDKRRILFLFTGGKRETERDRERGQLKRGFGNDKRWERCACERACVCKCISVCSEDMSWHRRDNLSLHRRTIVRQPWKWSHMQGWVSQDPSLINDNEQIIIYTMYCDKGVRSDILTSPPSAMSRNVVLFSS